MRRWITIVLVLVVAAAAWAQEPTPMIHIGTTDPVQLNRWLIEAAQEARRLQQLTEMVRQTNAMVQAQLQVVEELSRGEWENVLNAYQLQAQALRSMDGVMQNADDALRLLDLDALADMEELADLQAASAAFTGAYGSSAEALREARRLGNNAAWRADRMAELQVMSAADPGLARQLQIENAQLALISGQLGEVSYALSALATAEEVRIREEQAALELGEKRKERFWHTNRADELYEPSYTEEEYRDTVMGDDVLRRGLRSGF